MSEWRKEIAPTVYYLEVMHRLRKRVMRVRMEIAEDWFLRASSRQRDRTHSIVSSWISGKEVHSWPSAGSWFSRFVTLWFLLVPKIKIKRQGLSFSNTWQRSEGCNRRHQDPNRSWIPILLWGVVNSLGQVCCIRGMLFWRGQFWFRRIIE
jgi:hypothetical protein